MTEAMVKPIIEAKSSTVDYIYREHLIERQAKAEKAMLKEFKEGNYTMESPLIKYNPYILNSLSAVMLFNTEEPTAITIRVKGKTEKADFYQSFPKATEHIIPIVGLYSDYDNQIEVYPWQKFDQKVTHTITTPEVRGAGLVEHMDTTPEYMQDNVIFLMPANLTLAIAVDYAGDVRLDFTEATVWDIKRLANGNFLVGSERLIRMPYFVSGLYELSAVGKIYKEYRVPHGYHHDQIVLPNGDLVALNCNFPEGTVEDMAVVLDKDTGHVKKTFNFKDFLKPGCQKSGSWSDEDWFHCNAVWYDENSNSLTFSGRHINAMVNIDFDTSELNWIISDPEGWPEEYHEYLFKPLEGEFDWQYEQHANLITPLGDVMCFDNHHFGSQNAENYLEHNDSFSRGVKYRIDTEKMEIEQVWQYGKERGKDFFSPYICNVIYYNEGHYLTHSGGIAFDLEGNAHKDLGPFAMIEEPDNTVLKSITVETINDVVAMELEVNSNYYRAGKFTLYAKEEGQSDLTLGQGLLLGSLGETPQMDTEVPTEETNELLSEWHEGSVIEEIDILTFKAKFEPGTLAMLVLEGDKETRQYFISTSKGKRGAMCTGTFLPDDDRDTTTTVTKDGLDGEYNVKIIVNDKKYDSGVKIRA